MSDILKQRPAPVIRELSADEVRACLAGAHQFFDEADLPVELKPEVFIRNWQDIIDSKRGAIMAMFDGEKPVAGLGAVLAPDLNSNTMMAIECWWHVQKPYRSLGYGQKLLDAYEDWAKDQGATRICMVHLVKLQPEKLGSLFESRGYSKVEVNYVKIL